MFLCHEAHPNADAIGPAILRPGVAEAGLTDAPPHLALIARAAFRGQASVDTPQATAPAVMNTHANPNIPNPDRGPEQRPPFHWRCPGASHVPGTTPAGRAICVACVADLPASTNRGLPAPIPPRCYCGWPSHVRQFRLECNQFIMLRSGSVSCFTTSMTYL
jgi:hypothetical protein